MRLLALAEKNIPALQPFPLRRHGVLVDRDAVHVVRALGEVASSVAVRARQPGSRRASCTRSPRPSAPTLDDGISADNASSADCRRGGRIGARTARQRPRWRRAPHRRRARASTISSASERWASRRWGAPRRARPASASISSTGRSENVSSCALDLVVGNLHPVLAELVRAGLRRRRATPGAGGLAQLRPVGRPSAAASENACTWSPRLRRIRSTPAMMLPHWSDPPIWMVQPRWSCSHR